MKIQFLGATRQVTGSCYLFEAGGLRILIDCGMFQEREFLKRNWEPCPAPPQSIDYVLLTHAHLDHCGRLPKLVRDGYRGLIVTTAPSVELARLIMTDSAKIQREDVSYKKRRHRKQKRKSTYPYEPLYTDEDADRTANMLSPVSYGTPEPLNDRVTVTWHDAGHILGSAMLQIRVRENGREQCVVFSGDIGQWDKPLIRDPSLLDEADYVIMESTYGDKDHDRYVDIEEQLARIVNDTTDRGGKLLIPTFAVERAQELIYFLGRLRRADRIPQLPVYLDSPMAADVTEIFRRHRGCFDQATLDIIESGDTPLRFPGFKLARSAEDSKAINDVRGPCIVMSTSGMCTAGRIKHHLVRNISRPESTVMFVGYQASGTLGRHILRGEPQVRIHGKTLPVKARIEQIQGFSAHAGRAGLLRWLGHLKSNPQHVFLTHGEENVALQLADQLKSEGGYQVTVPEYQEEVELD